jgi:hypothetical protein
LSVRFRQQIVRDFALEFLNYAYSIVSTEYILFSTDHWVLYLFAGVWSVFGHLPRTVVFIAIFLC